MSPLVLFVNVPVFVLYHYDIAIIDVFVELFCLILKMLFRHNPAFLPAHTKLNTVYLGANTLNSTESRSREKRKINILKIPSIPKENSLC